MARALRLLVTSAVLCLVAGLPPAFAQRTSDASVLISASNRGIFRCTIGLSIFNFGSVDADGTDYGTPNVVAGGRNPTNTGGRYTSAPGAIPWTCKAAPPKKVLFRLASTTADYVGPLDPDNLHVAVPSTGGGTWTTYQPFLSQHHLIINMTVGNGANAVDGEVRLRLSIFDDDDPGVSVWVLRLRATGTP